MKINQTKTTVLFDLDGTLLPMDVDKFTKVYFHGLASTLGTIDGKSKDEIVSLVWAATKKMIKNDGTQSNKTVFWNNFFAAINSENAEYTRLSDEYYVSAFNDVKSATEENPYARTVLDALRSNGIRTVLATNPIFPRSAVATRLSWIGLSEDDFDYITTYESENYCKPNPKYYAAILEKLGLTADECIMVGNDEHEDMYAASQVGLDTYCINDCALSSKEYPYTGKGGSMKEFCDAVCAAFN